MLTKIVDKLVPIVVMFVLFLSILTIVRLVSTDTRKNLEIILNNK